MKPWDKLTIIRNRYRVRDLRRFRSVVEAYYQHSDDLAEDLPVDWQAVQEARAQINRMLPRITQVVQSAHLGSAPATGRPGVAVGRLTVVGHVELAGALAVPVRDRCRIDVRHRAGEFPTVEAGTLPTRRERPRPP